MKGMWFGGLVFFAVKRMGQSQGWDREELVLCVKEKGRREEKEQLVAAQSQCGMKVKLFLFLPTIKKSHMFLLLIAVFLTLVACGQ